MAHDETAGHRIFLEARNQFLYVKNGLQFQNLTLFLGNDVPMTSGLGLN